MLTSSQSQRSEELSELYYVNQKMERSDPKFRLIPSVVHKFRPNYPCLAGTVPLGLGDSVGGTVRDGHQFACGLHSITGSPIVFSFGCYRRQDYEKSLLIHRPDAVISIFELLPDMLVPDYQRGDYLYLLFHTYRVLFFEENPSSLLLFTRTHVPHILFTLPHFINNLPCLIPYTQLSVNQ